MIVGIFRFMFVRFPVAIYEALVLFFPTAVKIVRLLILLMIWSALTFGPVFAAFNMGIVMEAVHFTGIGSLAFYWCIENEITFRCISVGWSILAVCGSVWGAVYVRRRALRRRSQESF